MDLRCQQTARDVRNTHSLIRRVRLLQSFIIQQSCHGCKQRAREYSALTSRVHLYRAFMSKYAIKGQIVQRNIHSQLQRKAMSTCRKAGKESVE
eukprot:scaffold297195_cov18-Tisochrysis_lutea.AAC.1